MTRPGNDVGDGVLRRHLLRTIGGSAVLLGLAGCAALQDTDDDEDVSDEDDDTEPASVTFTIEGVLLTEDEVNQGSAFDASALIKNTGTDAGEQTVEAAVNSEVRTSETVSLDAGASETVAFDSIDTGDFEPDEYLFEVRTDDDEAAQPIFVLFDIPVGEQPPSVEPADLGVSPDPPGDATYLWNGQDATLDLWRMGDGSDANWEETQESFHRGSGDLFTRPEIGDCQLHLEWSSPDEPSGSGQSRGNSGVFMMEDYEFQVLDNYDNPTYGWGWAGGYYGQASPLVSPLRPPTEWNEYDMIWRSPRFDDAGNLTRPAQGTLFVNGVVVIAHLDIAGTSGGTIGAYSEHPPERSLRLQDHTDDVHYRNIWYRDLPEDAWAIPNVDESELVPQEWSGAAPDILRNYDSNQGEFEDEEPATVNPGGLGTTGTPPSDADVILDAGHLDAWESVDGGAPDWTVTDDYVEVEPGSGDIISTDTIGDCQLHLEWRSPEEKAGAGLTRGASGLFLMGEYGFQILDNDGNPVPADRWVGAYIDQAGPIASPLFNRDQWHAFDLVWQGPRFDDGELTRPPQATLLLNGVVVQERLVLEGPNVDSHLGSYEPHGPDAPLRLRDDGTPVRFRNVWWRELGGMEF